MINYIDVDDQYLSKDLGFSNDTNTSLKSNSIGDNKERIDAKTDSDIHSSSQENRNSQKDSPSKSSNNDQSVDEFVSKIDLNLLYMIDNIYMPVYVKGFRRTKPVNKFFQFKSVVANSIKLWTMLSEEQKKFFKKLYENTLKFHNDESILNTFIYPSWSPPPSPPYNPLICDFDDFDDFDWSWLWSFFDKINDEKLK
ncbi:12491_t:CDS:2 [Gigaspora margarita]|uniref:12491_t:CDS:1 n=1 Tax=Gigaspora margarita TaxID=4874 RepID=A0ABM8W6S0_GIGMA|nr:12491_t:CDS:2 [Gigaspora margarita]